MPIGDTTRDQHRTFTDQATGRTVKQLTTAAHHSYPLYYFIPSHTTDGRYMIVHSERTGWVQLHRLDLTSGELVQLTDGRVRDSGWARWCQPHLRGIFNHLSALNRARNEVYYFDEPEDRVGVMRLCATHVESLAHRVLVEMPGRISIGQSACSPDGKHFAFIHADHDSFRRNGSDAEALQNMGFNPWADHEQWREANPATISVVDCESDACRTVIDLPYHVHHVIFVDNETLLVNHTRGGNGMWIIKLDGTGERTLRPPGEDGTRVCHQVVTARGIFYEAFARFGEDMRNVVGRYDLAEDTFDEHPLDAAGYTHTGFDPLGRFRFFEVAGERQEIVALLDADDPQRRPLACVRTLAPYPAPGQRFHAHPFLANTTDVDHDRRWLYHTAVIDGVSQVCAVDAADLIARANDA